MANPNVKIKTEYDKAKRILKPIFIPFNRYVTYIGRENIVKYGPNLIIANHPGIGRDIAGILTANNRQLYFLTAQYMFDEKESLKHIKSALGQILYPIMYPIALIFAKYLSGKLNKFEMIPNIPKFHPTVGKIVYELYQEHGLKVPVSPVSIYGAEGLNPFKKMVINFGKAIDITSCIDNCTVGNPINIFTKYLEKKVADLLIESGLPRTSKL